MSLPRGQGRRAAWRKATYYVEGHSTGWGRHLVEQLIFGLFGWIPGVIGIGLRGLVYRLVLRSEGFVGIETDVRLAQPQNITLHRGAYLDHGVYLHACPKGIEIGEDSCVMHHAELHVYNFRSLPHAGIRVGRDSLIGEFNVIRGQGGVAIGDRVYTSPLVQILAVNHVYDDPARPFVEQGITARGIVIEDDVWVGAGAIITDGVRIGRGAVVGAAAVVTRDVPAHAVVAGVPATVVKEIGRDRPKDREAGVEVYF